MCRIDLCGQIGVKISSYGDRQFIKINPLNRPWGRFLRREDTVWQLSVYTQEMKGTMLETFFFRSKKYRHLNSKNVITDFSKILSEKYHCKTDDITI